MSGSIESTIDMTGPSIAGMTTENTISRQLPPTNHHQYNHIESILTTLQPIRDLAKNWDIDIATCLDEYLIDLEFSQDTREQMILIATTNVNNHYSNSCNFNFAQAAMVLQNSSGIYSRKVDYLHTHVYKIQEDLISTLHHHKGNQQRKSNSRTNPAIDPDIEEFMNFDPYQEFLLLNDVIPTCHTDTEQSDLTKINIPGRRRSMILSHQNHPENNYDDDDNHDNNDAAIYNSNSRRMSIGRRSSIGTSHSTYLNQTTMTRMSIDSRISLNNNTLSRQSLLFGNMYDRSTQGITNGGGNSTLHLQTGVCIIGDDGILRIPGSSITQQPPIVDSRTNDDCNNSLNDSFNNHAITMNHDDGDDDDNGGFMINMDTNDENESNVVGENVVNQERPKRVTFSDSVVPSAPETSKEIFRAHTSSNDDYDPWALLDRDAIPTTTTHKPRPLRVGKTIVLPSTVNKLPSECVTGVRTRYNSRIPYTRTPKCKSYENISTDDVSAQILWGGSSTSNKRAWQSTNRNPSSVVSLTAMTTTFGNEFDYIIKAIANKKRQANKLQRELLLLQQEKRPPIEMTVEATKSNDITDDGSGVYPDYEDDDDYDYPTSSNNMDDDFVTATQEQSTVETNTGIASISEIFNKNRDLHNGDINSKDNTRTFEELCRAHIAAFARGAEKYAVETKLSTRVGQWQGKLLPLLDEEDRRPVFDIHNYGDTVIKIMEKHTALKVPDFNNNVEKSKKVVAFQDITRNCEPYDVCRMFLAALSLNNSGNIQFTADSTLDSIRCELISTVIERPMESYLAPSLENTLGRGDICE